ncbi:MAG: hypothetical protein U9P50_02715 [Patescibacteria group bacterium]|nr:hypothetical protein [Patescibacteria group bacterium]
MVRLVKKHHPDFDFSKPIPKSRWKKLRSNIFRRERFEAKKRRTAMNSRH